MLKIHMLRNQACLFDALLRPMPGSDDSFLFVDMAIRQDVTVVVWKRRPVVETPVYYYLDPNVVYETLELYHFSIIFSIISIEIIKIHRKTFCSTFVPLEGNFDIDAGDGDGDGGGTNNHKQIGNKKSQKTTNKYFVRK